MGGPESIYRLGGGVPGPPPLKKALENRYRVHSQIFQDSKRILTHDFYCLSSREGLVKGKKGKTNLKNIFLVLNKYQSVTHVYTSIFQGLLKNIFFKIYSFSHKKVMGYFRFFLHRPDFLPRCILPFSLKKIHRKIL